MTKERYPSSFMSPCHVIPIIENGGLKKYIKEQEQVKGKKLAYLLNSHYELLIVPRGRKRLYDPETLRLKK